MSFAKPSCRLESVDILRGIAVLTMIQQHVLFWLCSDIRGNLLVLVLNALGGLAAPLFVTLAGVGSSLAVQRLSCWDLLIPLRGAILIGFGYLLNLLAPHWFFINAWYILHLIGFALIIGPLLQRISSAYIMAMMAAVILITAILQIYFETPFKLFNHQMGISNSLRDFLKHVLAEGFFPIFPWLAYFMAGMVSGRWLIYKEEKKIGCLAIALFATFMGLIISALICPLVTKSVWLSRFFTFIPTFYPALIPITLLLMSLSLLFLFAARSLEAKMPLHNLRILAYLGKSSLTLLMVHVVIIRGAAYYFKFWKTFPAVPSIAVTYGVLLLVTVMVCQWYKINFRYGTEWLLRAVSNKILSVMGNCFFSRPES